MLDRERADKLKSLIEDGKALGFNKELLKTWDIQLKAIEKKLTEARQQQKKVIENNRLQAITQGELKIEKTNTNKI